MKRLLLTMLLLPLTVSAVDLNAKSGAFCGKIKTCVLEGMGSSDDITPEMEAMIKPMIDGMCDQIMQSAFNEAEQAPKELESDIAACMDSVMTLSCDELMNGQSRTSACKYLEEKAKKYLK